MAALAAKWIRVTSSARLQRSSQCLLVLGPRAWIFGGELQPRQPVDSQFDVISLEGEGGSEAVTASGMPDGIEPIPRVGSATATVKDVLYMFSGRGGLEMKPIEEHGALWQYNPGESLWNFVKPADPAAPYPPGRSYHAMTSDSHGNIYIHAGCPEQGRLSDLWSFNTQSKTWTQLEAAPLPARGGTSIAVHKDKLYRMNGFDGKSEQGGEINIYDIKSRIWSTFSFPADGIHGPIPRSVSSLLAIQVGGKDYLLTLFGERDPSSLGHAGAGKMLGDVWAFDLESKTWTKVEHSGDSPAPRGWFGADILRKESGEQLLIVHGGLAEDNARLGDVWKLEFV